MPAQIFDALSYAKAASGADLISMLRETSLICIIVLRMLSEYIGEELFLKGVSIYLKKHLYSNTVSRDLWEGIGEATGDSSPPSRNVVFNIVHRA